MPVEYTNLFRKAVLISRCKAVVQKLIIDNYKEQLLIREMILYNYEIIKNGVKINPINFYYGNLSPVTENLGSFRVSSTSWSANLSKQQLKEALKCLDFAFNLDYVRANRFDLWSGKLSATLSSFMRRAIFKFLG